MHDFQFNADHLIELAELLDNVKQSEFGMSEYANYACRTPSCSLGHFVAHKDAKLWDAFQYGNAGSHALDHWAINYFGLVGSGYRDNQKMAWLFDSKWNEVDDTPQGAAARVRYLLEYGNPPQSFVEMGLHYSIEATYKRHLKNPSK